MRCASCLLRSDSVRSVLLIQQQVLRRFHGSPACTKSRSALEDVSHEDNAKTDKSLVSQDDPFEQVPKDLKTKSSFIAAVDVFTRRDVRRRGHVEFIYAALKKMAAFGVERDLSVYNKLLDVFPKDVFVPRNFIQRMYNHYPRQQQCGVQVLEQMESYGVTPNVDTKVLLMQIFGKKSHPVRKFQRIMYWFPKFKHINPFPVPQPLPEDPVDLSRFSLIRIAADLDARVTVYQMPSPDVTESEERLPHIVGIQSPSQMELLSQHNLSRPVFVEGPFPLWLKRTCVHYYVLRSEPRPPEEKVEEPYDPERCFYFPLHLDLDLDRDLGDEEDFDVDDLDEGPVYAMCMTGRGDQATLSQWISGLQQTNPILGHIPTLFRLNSGPRATEDAAGAQPDPGTPPSPIPRAEEEEPEVREEEELSRRQ